MKFSLPSKRTIMACVRGALVGSIGLSLGFYLVMMHPIPGAVRPLSMHFQRQYQEANIVLPELTEGSSVKEKLEYLELLREWSSLKANVVTAALAEYHIGA